jgi:glycosyltransferase
MGYILRFRCKDTHVRYWEKYVLHRWLTTDIRRITNLSLETGLTGLLHYILTHIKGAIQRNDSTPFDPIYLTDLYTITNRIIGQTEDTELKDLSEKYIHYYKTKEEPDYNQDFTQFPTNEKQKIALKDIAAVTSLLWRVAGGGVKKVAGGELFIFNDKSIASNYGIGTYLREYLYCLEQINFSINLIELNSTQQAYSIQKDSIKRFYFPHSPHGINKKYYQSVVRMLRLYIDNTQTHIFHLNYEYAEFLVDELKLHFPNSKIIATIHYSYSPWMLNVDNKEYRRIVQTPTSTDELKYANLIKIYTFSKKFYDKVDHLIVLCEDTFLALHENYLVPQEKMSFIPNGIRHLKRKLLVQEKQQIRKRYHLREDEKIILYVGRLQASKGILVLIKAFAFAFKKHENCRLVVVGVGSDSDFKQTIEQCQDIGTKITFTGEISQQILFEWYQIADIGVIPSYLEQCSYAGIEMMMHQLPIVASDAHGVRNMFKEGENALIAKIGDCNNENEFIQNLANRMLELLLDDKKRGRIALNARKVYEDKYVIEKMRDAYLQLFNSLLKSVSILSLKMKRKIIF